MRSLKTFKNFVPRQGYLFEATVSVAYKIEKTIQEIPQVEVL